MAAIVTAPGDPEILTFLSALRRAGGGIPLIRNCDKAVAARGKVLGYVHLPDGRSFARLTGLGQLVLDRGRGGNDGRV